MAFGVITLEILCCLGLGAVVLKLLRIGDEFTPGEHAAFAFVAGFGMLGWLIFPLGLLGLLDKGWLFGLLIAGSSGIILLKQKGLPRPTGRLDGVGRGLSALILTALLFDLAEGLSPPGDADSLAYHFTAVKHFLEAGRIVFILRPGDGAIPYLTQMTYLPALALGGEQALTLWTMVSGWAATALLFVLCRHHLNRNWSLAVTLIFLTTPAMIYGAGTGQIEARLAMFVMVAAWAAARALESGRLNYAMLAGLAVGFYGGSKYLGLLFAVACGLTLLAQRRWLIHGLVFSAVALTAGFQWYAWNGLNTGDPFFPMFFQWLGRDDLLLWSKEQNLFYRQVFMNYDRPLPRTLFWFFLFPFQATLDSPSIIEAKFVGLGPFALLVLPFAALGIWKFRSRVLGSRLLIYGIIAFLFYALWFFSGPSQRVRHLLPVLPLLLICLTVAAERFSSQGRFRWPLAAAVSATVLFQMSTEVVFSIKYLRYVMSNESRESFLFRNVKNYAPVPWINAHLSRSDKLFIGERQLFYFLEMPYLFSSPHTQSAVNTREEQQDPAILFRQLKAAGITHVLVGRSNDGEKKLSPRSLDLLSHTNCLELLNRFETQGIGSRTFSETMSSKAAFDLLKLNADCLP
ncbi:MAG: hypothetical protein A3G18_09275 [Rhodospirillales bacterium RIFCSPLOWO2_12_FULL_58_28]|nr:MAG: hypothetical protein A3H92_02395 [Rhodospirillales bacterium RIFCSPLOWO2_02_FULL_58_16]OHC76696.1 MAG: hypothetical protein A3G18_09275 [Rhodospirillales bacterium RIFCSPLOWO2_12_FULL_58_28]